MREVWLRLALGKLSKLRGVGFDWKRDDFPDHDFSDNRQVGFIAQEINEVLPEVVSQGSDGYYSVDYGRLTPVMVEAIKVQQEQIASLKTENAALRAEMEDRIASLEKKFSELGAKVGE